MHLPNPSGDDNGAPNDPDEQPDDGLISPSETERDDGRRRRMAPSDRRSMILEQAAEFFATNGPAASTRALARALGITQALLYRYFPSKEALVRAVYQERFGARWDSAWNGLLHDRTLPLAERLTSFFVPYIDRLSPPDYRLWMRAALEGWSFARLYHNDLVEHVLTPIVAELRHEAGLAGFESQPITAGELEIAFTLHGALIFLRIRRDIYGAPVPSDMQALVSLQVGIFLPGARQQIARLHRPGAPDSLTIPPLTI